MEKKTLLINARLLDVDRADFFDGELLLGDGVILAIGAPGTLPRDGAQLLDAGGRYVAPGLVDIHTHGRAGGDFNTADISLLQRMSLSYLRAGVTTVMPTLASAPYDSYGEAADRIAHVASAPEGARFYGLHLEGRYLNPAKRGAHASELIAPLDANELECLSKRMRAPFDNEQYPMRVSAALELDENAAFSEKANQLGIHLSLAHTTASYAQATAAIRCGARCFTHLFNAMPPLHHREGGAVLACFDSEAYGELICDGFHISPEMVRFAYRMLGDRRTVLISDSMEGTACPDGDYNIAGMPVTVRNGKAYTSEGAIAGSTLDLLDGVRNLMQFCGISLAGALCCATVNPARAAGIDHVVGALRPGLAADLILLDTNDSGDLKLSGIYVGGEDRGEVLS